MHLIKSLTLICFLLIAQAAHAQQIVKKAIPGKLVVLTFDDAAKSHYNYVAPLLKKYKFGATFYVCEFQPDFADTTKYMTWPQIDALGKMGFEIANHTWHHKHVNKLAPEALTTELEYIEHKCHSLHLPRPTSFAYPGYDVNAAAVKALQARGYTTARAGGSRPYNPLKDSPFLIPSYSTSGTDTTALIKALQSAKNGSIIVLTVHGVPDYAHNWVTTPPGLFEYYLNYMYTHHYKVVAMKDLSQYIDLIAAAGVAPNFTLSTKN